MRLEKLLGEVGKLKRGQETQRTHVYSFQVLWMERGSVGGELLRRAA